MSNFRKIVTFDALIKDGVLEIGDGHRAKLEELGGDGPIFLRAGAMTKRGFDWAASERFYRTIATKLGAKLGRPGDTVVTTKGNSVGRTSYVSSDAPEFVYSPHLSYWRSLDQGHLVSGFLRYWSQSPEFSDQLRAMAHGTDMAPYLSLIDQRRIRISLPSVAVQAAIASLLGALDNKVVINEQLADNLLAASGAYFQILTNDSAQSLSQSTFGDVADIYGGGTPSTTEPTYWGGEIMWATPTDITKLDSPYLLETDKRITEDGLRNCASSLHPSGSIFMTSRATIGRFAVNEVPAATNQGFIVVRPRRSHELWWLYHEMHSRVDEMISISNGSTFLELSRRNFKQMSIARPSERAILTFHETVDQLHRRASAAIRENRTLAELRDTLLPKLISGEIRIKNAEHLVSDAT